MEGSPNLSAKEIFNAYNITIDDSLYQKALELADTEMDKVDLFREVNAGVMSVSCVTDIDLAADADPLINHNYHFIL
jgi:hypothetical protein